MPIYEYRCTNCDESWVTQHSMNETKTRCPGCKQETLERAWDDEIFVRQENKAGQITKEAIETAKKDLEKQKEETRKELKT